LGVVQLLPERAEPHLMACSRTNVSCEINLCARVKIGNANLPIGGSNNAMQAMRDALGAHFVQDTRDLDRILQHLIGRQRSFLQTLRQRLAFEIFNRQKFNVVMVPVVVERTVVRVVQTGNGLYFALEPRPQSRAAGEMRS